MSLIESIAELVEEPRSFVGRADVRGMGRAGIFGYVCGTLSVFVFLRLFSVVPPGLFSFLNVLALVLGVNFCFAAGIHLFLEMTGASGNALRLFFIFGLTELFWSLLIPLGFAAKLGYLNPAVDCLMVFTIVILARISLMRRLYVISRKKALLSLGLPYAAFFAGTFMAFVYSVVCLVWLFS
jgi:hypothetical protein